MILVTGRIMSELEAVFPGALDHVDAIVAENGAVLATRAGLRLLAAPVGRAVSAGLGARGVAHRSGQVLVACAAADEPAVSEVIRELGLDSLLVRNRGELMIVPAGVTKRSGLIDALRSHAPPARSEFRYGSFSCTLELPPGADADDVTARYANGILTIKVAVKGERQEAVKRIPVTSGKK